jgi:hypothetical protein
MSYVILTSKDGAFRTEADASLRPVETYEYLFCGRRRATFTLAEIVAETRVKVIEVEDPSLVNLVPSKFLPHFDSLDEARRALTSLTRYGEMDTALRKVA